MTAHRLAYDLGKIPKGNDPGDTGTFDVLDRSLVYYGMVSAAAETRTLARANSPGKIVTIALETDGGDVTLTVTGGYEPAGDTTIIFDDEGDYVTFISVNNGSDVDWRILGSSGTDAVEVLGGFSASTLTATTGITLSATGTSGLDLSGVADALILDADDDTTISAPTDDQIDVEVGGTDRFTVTNEGIVVAAGSSLIHHRNRCRFFDDFFLIATSTETSPEGIAAVIDVDGAGPPTQDYVNDAANGEYLFTTEATSERQGLLIKPMGDQLLIDLTKNPIVEFRIKVSPAGATFTADERVAFGLLPALAAAETTLEDIDNSVFFRLEGANLNILVEADDGTTDTNDQDSTIDYVKGTYAVYRIDCSTLTAIGFYVDGVEQGGAAVSAPLLTGNVQPFIVHQRDAGTEVNTVTIDYVYCEWDR